MGKHYTTLLMAVGLALVLGDTARADDGVEGMARTNEVQATAGKRADHACAQPTLAPQSRAAEQSADKQNNHRNRLTGAPFDPQIGRIFRDNTGA